MSIEKGLFTIEAISDELTSYVWKGTSHVDKVTVIIAYSVEIVLCPDGTYFLNDLAGG